MKKIFTFSIASIFLFVLFTGCVKQVNYIDESYWLNQERGTVVHSDPYCAYYVLETFRGYNILRVWDNYKPYEGDILYGNFSSYGVRDFYNRSRGYVYTGDVKEFWLNYFDAQNAITYYCY